MCDGRKRRQIIFEDRQLRRSDGAVAMHFEITRQRHRARLNHVDRFKQLRSLQERRFRSDLRKIEMLASVLYVLRDNPINRCDLIKPGKARLIGVARVASPLQHFSHLGGCDQFDRIALRRSQRRTIQLRESCDCNAGDDEQS